MSDRPVIVETLSRVPLERLYNVDAATWLDKELIAEEPRSFRDSGFGRDVKAAISARKQWLVNQGLAQAHNGQTIFRLGMIETLRRRELLRVASQLSDKLGLRFAETKAGDQIEGTLRKQVEMTSGRYALVAKSKEFTLVPWRSVLDRHFGKQVSGIMRRQRVNWTLGKGRGGPQLPL